MCAAISARALSLSPRPIFLRSPISPKVVKCTPPKVVERNYPRRFLKSPETGFLNSCTPPNLFKYSPDHKVPPSVAIHSSPRSKAKPEKYSNASELEYLHLFPEIIPDLNVSSPPTSQPPHSVGYSPISPFRSPLYTPDRKKKYLGRGTFGKVILCTYNEHKFALKIVRRTPLSNIGESNFLSIRHPNLVRILRISQVLDQVFISMEFAGHSNLMQVLLNKKDIALQKKISFAYQVACGLNHCHENGIFHGDVKPSNVIVTPTGLCKLGDFGFSKKIQPDLAASNDEAYRKSFKGTVAYAAPEVIKGENYTTSSDIYSLGTTMWQIYTGEAPFSGMHPHVIMYKVVKLHERPVFQKPICSASECYITLVTHCWKKDPQSRPPSHNVVSVMKNLSSTGIALKLQF